MHVGVDFGISEFDVLASQKLIHPILCFRQATKVGWLLACCGVLYWLSFLILLEDKF